MVNSSPSPIATPLSRSTRCLAPLRNTPLLLRSVSR